jgi:hypothetical protein
LFFVVTVCGAETPNGLKDSVAGGRNFGQKAQKGPGKIKLAGRIYG